MAEVLDRRITLPDLIQKTATTPAALIGIPPAGFAPGDRADFALYPHTAVRVEPELLHSRCGWTPFEGHRAVFPQIVIRGGDVVYDNGDFCRKEPVWFAGRGSTHTDA
jgi:dihydroorotase